MLVAPMATPMASADSKTSARSSPDFGVTYFSLDGSGSVQDGVNIYVENATHTAIIIVSNTGSATDSVVVSLYHQGSASSTKTLVSAFGPVEVAPGTSHTPIGISWTASPGNGQKLFAETFSIQDPNSGNNEARIDFDVRTAPRYLVGTVTNNAIPSPAPGQTEAVIPSGSTVFNATVVNEGVEQITANLQLHFADTNSADTETLWSGEIFIQPGSLHTNPISSVASLTLNTASFSFSGVWTLTASVIFNGSDGWTDTQQISVTNVRFSEYAATLSTPADRSTEPGLTTTLNFWLTNTGSQDDFFNIDINSVRGWADLTLDGSQTASFSPGVTISIQIDVTVPSDAARTDTDTIVLTLTSVNDPNTPSYSLTATTLVSAGESYVAALTMPNTAQIVVPGDEVGFNATISNDGNTQGSFQLIAGFSSASSRWSVRLGMTTTTILAEDESQTFSVNVTVPPVKMPLDQADENREGDTMSVWVQAIPINGGIPVIANTPLTVAPVIVVDPGLNAESINLEAQDVVDAKNGNGLELFRQMDIEVRHNLNNPLVTTVDGIIEAGNMTFLPASSGGFDEVDRWNASVSMGFGLS